MPLAALHDAVAALRRELLEASPLAGDASTRRFFRLSLADGGTVVACLYPEGREHHARHDASVQQWCEHAGLPVPALLGRWGRVVLSEDLGGEALENAARPAAEMLAAILAALSAFQRCPWRGAPNPPFDARLLRREMAVFEVFAHSREAATRSYLDALAERVASHPFVLVHRDFHSNNLLWSGTAIRSVDFQDLRGGPDTYDAVSFLRERGGPHLVTAPATAIAEAALRLRWAPGWRDRYWECAAQRGLKVVGTFLRLVAAGRAEYAALLPSVREASREALDALGAPPALQRVASAAGL